MMKEWIRLLRMAVLAGVTMWMPVAALAERVEENPGSGRMMADLLVARPFGLVLFGLGAATYVATLPFSLLGGNADDVGRKLVVEPGKEVFVRCLGCSTPGRKEKLRR